MIGVYVRVSSVSQNEAGQRREINRWLQGNGIEQDQVRWYLDKKSGSKLDRPAFAELQRDVFNGEIETIVVWKLDRLSRSLRDGINILADWCDHGLRVVSVTQQIDFSGTMGKIALTTTTFPSLLVGVPMWILPAEPGPHVAGLHCLM